MIRKNAQRLSDKIMIR